MNRLFKFGVENIIINITTVVFRDIITSPRVYNHQVMFLEGSLEKYDYWLFRIAH